MLEAEPRKTFFILSFLKTYIFAHDFKGNVFLINGFRDPYGLIIFGFFDIDLLEYSKTYNLTVHTNVTALSKAFYFLSNQVLCITVFKNNEIKELCFYFRITPV